MFPVKHLEIRVAHACNLRCESCSHYSDQGHKGVVSLEDAERWMRAWRARVIQIEITTRCNYECFYCAGRDVPRRHMSWKATPGILHRVAERRGAANLQGEGEPTTQSRVFRGPFLNLKELHLCV